MHPVKLTFGALAAAVFVMGVSAAYGQEAAATNKFVSMEEYQKLKAEADRLRQEMDALKAQMQQLLKQPAPPPSAPATQAQMQELQKKTDAQLTEAQGAIDDLEKQVKEAREAARATFPGTTKMLLAGYGNANFTASSHGWGPATPVPPDTREGRNFFSAQFNPIFLWKLSDRLLFEGEIELELEEHDTTVNLEIAQISYVLNDYVTLGAGRFLNPMDYFVERIHPNWINKMPDKPLAVYDGLLAESILGAQVRGGFPLGPNKMEYAFYVANAPSLVTADDTSVGTLEFNNFDNVGNHVAVGGRVGVFILPELEVGYGFQVAGVGPPGTDLNSLLQSVDFSYVRVSDLLKGMVNLRAQWVWSGVDRARPDIVSGLDFKNDRNGGYAQLAYRPTKLTSFLKNFEPVVRYDALNQRDTPVGFDESRWAVGLNYWLGPSAVVKTAYQYDHQNGDGKTGKAVLVQVVVGF